MVVQELGLKSESCHLLTVASWAVGSTCSSVKRGWTKKNSEVSSIKSQQAGGGKKRPGWFGS